MTRGALKNKSHQGSRPRCKKKGKARQEATFDRQFWILSTILVVGVIVAYLPALNAGFIWDDDDYVTHNPVIRTAEGLLRIWVDPHSLPQYYPLVHTTYWVEYHLWGLAPFGYHLTNILLHAVNSILLFVVLRRLKVPVPWLVAAVFALHPVHVESVAWVTERKNVLSGFFYLLALLAWMRWRPLDAAPEGRAGPAKTYWAALAAFGCALLSKTVTCSLPAVILLLIWWKSGRLRWHDIAPTLPLFVVGLAMAMVTAWLEHAHVGASTQEWDLSIFERGLIAGRALWFYAAKLLWPAVLIFNYPRWHIDASSLLQYIFPVGFVVAGLTLWVLRKRLGRGPLVAVLIFAGSLVPALGFFNVYPMIYSFVADHYQYLPSIALIALACALFAKAVDRLFHDKKTLHGALALILLSTLGVLTYRQSSIYKNQETLWIDTMAKNPSSWLASLNLGGLRLNQGRFEEARRLVTRSLEEKKHNPIAHNNMGKLLYLKGDLAGARDHFKEALAQKPDNGQIHNNLGCLYWALKDWERATKHLHKAIDLIPNYPDAHLNLGKLSAQIGETDRAIDHLTQYLSFRPRDTKMRLHLADLLIAEGRWTEAVGHCQAIMAVNPDDVPARLKAAEVLTQAAEHDSAIDLLIQVLSLDEGHVEAQQMIVNVILDMPTGGNPAFAAQQAQLLLAPLPDQRPDVLRLLADALERRGRLSEAAEVQNRLAQPSP